MLFCTLAGVGLGFSQPFYIPEIFGDVGAYQDLFGLLALISYVPFFLVVARTDLKGAFLATILTLTVQFTIVLYWIYVALNLHGEIAPLPSAVITVLLPFVLALMGSAFFTVARFLSLRFEVSFFWLAPVALCASEYFRNYYFFGGFPWGNVGYSLGRVDQFLQTASLFGVYGVVFLVGLINSLLALALTKRNILYGAGAFGIVIAMFVFGLLRMSYGQDEYAPTLRVALLQGNIPQEIKGRARVYGDEILKIYLDLHRAAKIDGAELIVWPESSYPKTKPVDVTDLGFSFEDHAASIIGAVVVGQKENESGYYVHNSGLISDFRGKIIKRYDKSHLVPFGEYVPWPMTGVVDKIVPGMGAFRPGTEFTPTDLAVSESKNIAVGTTVCYEGIFPEIARAYAKNGAQLLVNLTNDAWYEATSAPYQHLLMYRMRSVESGLPFVRATNTGMSAWIDVYGTLHTELGLFERGKQMANVPLIKKSTVYVVIGDVIPLLCVAILIIGFIAAVLPIHEFFRRRKWLHLLVMAILVGIAIWSSCYFLSARFLTDESARTKNFLVSLACLIVMIGVLAPSRRSRAILYSISVVVFLSSVGLIIFESWHFAVGVVVAFLCFLLAYRMRVE